MEYWLSITPQADFHANLPDGQPNIETFFDHGLLSKVGLSTG
jgi:hypothetical protein